MPGLLLVIQIELAGQEGNVIVLDSQLTRSRVRLRSTSLSEELEPLTTSNVLGLAATPRRLPRLDRAPNVGGNLIGTNERGHRMVRARSC